MSHAMQDKKHKDNSRKENYDFFVAVHFVVELQNASTSLQNGNKKHEKHVIKEISWQAVNGKNGSLGELQTICISDKSTKNKDECSLHDALQKFDAFVKKNFAKKSFVIVTDGTFSLENCLRGLKVAPYFLSYFDLQAEKKNKNDVITIQQMMDDLKISLNKKDTHPCTKTAQIISKLIQQGHKFSFLKHINSSTSRMNGSSVVRLRGLPWQATESDIMEFFNGLKIVKKGIHIALNFQGRATGEAYVEFDSEETAIKALARDRKHMGHRYIEIFPSTKLEMEHSKKVMERELGILGNSMVVRMRGLPFSATVNDIAKFFDGLEIVNGGIHIIIGPDGRPTGDAYVEFKNTEVVKEALKRNKEKIGNRYIELFRSTQAELQAANMYSSFYQYYLKTQQLYTQMNSQQFSEHVVRLRGLPFSCDEVDVADFFNGLNIADQGIHLVFNQYDKPTGEAFVEFKTANDVKLALERHKKQLGNRYIEVFKSTVSEMMAACGVEPPMDPNMMMMYPGMEQMYMYPEMYYGPYNHHMYNSGYYHHFNNYEYQNFKPQLDSKTVKMRGLPFQATLDDLKKFFAGFKIDEESIRFGLDSDGRPTGEAWVKFETEEEARRAYKQKNKSHIGKRYIELFIKQ